jgi:hypothetical protein
MAGEDAQLPLDAGGNDDIDIIRVDDALRSHNL